MDVEINDRDARAIMEVARPQRPDRDAVEQAEPHRAAGLGMVARRAHRTEGVARLARHDRIDGGADGTGGAQRRLARARRNDGIRVQPGMAAGRDGGEDGVDIAARMDTGDIVERGARRLAAIEPGEFRRRQRRENGAQALRRFGVIAAGIVVETGGMAVEQGRHRRLAALTVSAAV